MEPGDDFLFDGGVDFPLPLAPGGVGVRLPINGKTICGKSSLYLKKKESKLFSMTPCISFILFFLPFESKSNEMSLLLNSKSF